MFVLSIRAIFFAVTHKLMRDVELFAGAGEASYRDTKDVVTEFNAKRKNTICLKIRVSKLVHSRSTGHYSFAGRGRFRPPPPAESDEPANST